MLMAHQNREAFVMDESFDKQNFHYFAHVKRKRYTIFE